MRRREFITLVLVRLNPTRYRYTQERRETATTRRVKQSSRRPRMMVIVGLSDRQSR
jgi:hypothetical protein